MITLPKFSVPKSVAEAREIQEALRHKVSLTNSFGKIRTIGGVDCGYDTANDMAHASVVVLLFDQLKVIEKAQAKVKVEFPYIPGLLSFREMPAILAALSKLPLLPDLIMVDGQGIAHPRRLGIASHLGTLLDIPTIGVAKSRLTGRFTMPGEKKGSMTSLMYGKERIGTVLRSRDNVKPLFISPGHRIDVKTATAITVKCLTHFRLPEPTRMADKFSKIRKPELQFELVVNEHENA